MFDLMATISNHIYLARSYGSLHFTPLSPEIENERIILWLLKLSRYLQKLQKQPNIVAITEPNRTHSHFIPSKNTCTFWFSY